MKIGVTLFLCLFLYMPCRSQASAALSEKEIVRLLAGQKEITREDLISLHVLPPEYTVGMKSFVYYDTTVFLNNSLFYSIISLGDSAGICSHFFIVTADREKEKAITAAYLMPDCDSDLSRENETRYEYKVLSKDTVLRKEILITRDTAEKQGNREETEKIKEVAASYFIIQPSGEIKVKESAGNLKKND